MEFKEIEFEKLRHAYITVKNFVETEAWGEMKSLKTKTERDLGITGDDAYELLEKFVVKFELDPKNFEFLDHFTGEAELAEGCMWTLLALPVFLSLKTIELITHDKVEFSKLSIFNLPEKKKDLTFRDLITWYVEKEFKPRESVKYKIKYNLGKQEDKS